MAIVFSSESSLYYVFLLALAVAGAWGRPVRLNDNDQFFICPKQSLADFACVDPEWEIGTSYSEEQTGSQFRKLLQYFGQPHSSRSSYLHQRSSPYRTSHGSYPPYNTRPSSRGFPSGGSSGGSFPSGGSVGGCSRTDPSVEAILACTNAVRQNPRAYQYPCPTPWLGEYGSGRGPLAANGQLMSAAQQHSNYQANMGLISHSGPGGSSVGSRVRRAGYGFNSVAENVAKGQRSAYDVVMQWMCSGGHRRNMMSCSYADIGIGVTCRGDCYFTQDFGCRGSCGCNGGSSFGGSNPTYNGNSYSPERPYGNSYYPQQPTQHYNRPSFPTSFRPQQPNTQYSGTSFPHASGPHIQQQKPHTYSRPSFPSSSSNSEDSLMSLFNSFNTDSGPTIRSSDSSTSFGPDPRNSGSSSDFSFPFLFGN